MTNLPVPTLPNEVPGNFIASAVFNTVGLNGLGFSLSPPVATLYQATIQSLTSSSNAAITLDAESIDTYGGHNTVTNNSRYVGQVPGYYAIYGVVCFASNATGIRAITIAKNGSLTSVPGGFGIFSATSGVACAQAFGVIQLNGTTDYLEIYADQNSGGTISTSVAAVTQQSMMTIWWLHT